MFSSLLIANRGEIAVRIAASAKALGIRTIAVHSEADADALHVRVADEAHCVGPSPARESYLSIPAVIQAALNSGAEAIHPGYGFLSENGEFARAVEAAGLIFVGPSADTIDVMGDKVAARKAAVSAGVPVLAGSETVVKDPDEALRLARNIGFPIAVKACFGGGGRGMRVVEDQNGLEEAMASASRESAAAFGRAEIFLEAFLQRPRHVEVQIVGDARGHVIHLGDRDCSVQRRHQKMIEEAPAPRLSPELREAMLAAAVSLSKAIGYRGVGTVEFLVDSARGGFFFLEMNTRLQVEHGVTERVTGIDLVETQLAIACDMPLEIHQNDVRLNGHAIQARISAEDPWGGFAPDPGRIVSLALPFAPWMRIDFGVEQGDQIQPHYDSMMGKLIAWGPDRDSARVRLREGLLGLKVGGIKTTAPYLANLLEQPEFKAVDHYTGSVESDWAAARFLEPEPDDVPQEESPMPNRVSERLVGLGGDRQRQVAVYGVEAPVALLSVPSRRATRSVSTSLHSTAGNSSGTSIVAPMDSVVVHVPATEGDKVRQGHTLLVLEAMKMEVAVGAPTSGKVLRLHAKIGQAVRKGQLLADLE